MLIITSPAFVQNAQLPKKYTCDGEGVNPPLSVKNIPAQTKSLALIVDDPDAPTGTYTHLICWNIDPKNAEIAEKSLPNYIAACPPSGTHHYNFKVYALDSTLSLHQSASRQELEDAMKNHILNEGILTAVYSRNS
jgi:hypothetical protein